LNGRSYTDLLAIQPGLHPDLFNADLGHHGGGHRYAQPSGDANPATFPLAASANPQRLHGELDGRAGAHERRNVGDPNLDSIAEFRVLTNNFDPEYGNYNGGMINVVTKSGSNAFHGDGFEFLRNTDLDAKNFFDATAAFPAKSVRRHARRPDQARQIVFFSDYQGTETTQGITSPVSTVLSAQERAGNFSDALSSLTGTVSGPYAASQLTQKLGYSVAAGEPYFTPGCTSATCVLPGESFRPRHGQLRLNICCSTFPHRTSDPISFRPRRFLKP